MNETNALVKLDTATRMLAEAKTLEEVKYIVDIAEAARTYARAAKLGLEAYNHAAEVKVRAERKAGEMLAKMDKHPPGPEPIVRSQIVTEPPTLAELGIEKMQSSRWQQLASMPEDEFEKHIEETRGERPITTSGIVREIIKQANINKPEVPLPKGLFNVIYADPPWQFENSGFDQSAASHYPTMATDKICQLKIPSADDAVLFLWATNAMLLDALEVMDSWGFEYKSNFVWVKNTGAGIGWFVLGRHELLLIGIKGNMSHPQVKPLSVISAEVVRHSEKPVIFYDIIESMYKGGYLELFARNKKEGWASWGNEVADS